MPQKKKKNGRPLAGAKAARMRSAAAQHSDGDFMSAFQKNIATTQGFTMRDEARNTGQHQSTWGREKLRGKPITFVSAGLIEPLKDLESNDDPKHGLTSPGLEQPAEVTAKPSVTEEQAVERASASTPVQHPNGGDSENGSSRQPGAAETANHPGFYFDLAGDANLKKPSLPPATIPVVTSPAAESEESDSSEVIVFKGRSGLSRNNGAKQSRITLDEINLEIRAVERSFPAEPKSDSTPTHHNALPGQRFPDVDHLDTKSEEDAAILADYIANMAEDSDQDRPYSRLFNHRDLGGDEQSGLDQSTDETGSADEEGDTEEDEADKSQDPSESIGPDPMMDDETLARLLSKQEELGMGGEELLLSDMYLDTDDTGHAAGSSRQSNKPYKPQRTTKYQIPSASAVADAFDDIDLMDWNRPSLQNFTKGRRRKPIFDVADPVLELNMQAAWETDRERKKQRKLAREELRAQGLLGKHANPDDPRVKYPSGMTLEDIKVEVRAFLLSPEEQILQLPPMDKSARKILHELANRFNIKSHSTGSGDQRRPTLHRTKRTFTYVEDHFEAAIARVSRKYFPRLDMKGKAPQRRAGGGAGHSAVSCREGEVVGASAPELGQDNKGRAMLEKMGWSTGTALGAMDNKGILQPVAHVVKRTKAGLGQG